jgi:COP9 signalosome complex subunit 7
MEQLKALNALEPFIILSKSANSPRAAADLVTQATSAPNTFVFAELLQTPNIRALAKSKDYSSYLTLLEIFSWGAWADYEGMEVSNHGRTKLAWNRQSAGLTRKPPSATPSLPKLSPKQHEKLLLLSLLPLASQISPLPYLTIQATLSLPTTAAVEAFLTTAFYANLIHGSLDPHRQMLHITSVAPLRDLAPGSVLDLARTFDDWSAQCGAMLDELQRQMELVEQAAAAKVAREERVAKMFEERMAAEELGWGKRKGVPDGKDRDAEHGDDADSMDLDGEAGRPKGTKRTLLGLGKKIQGSSSQS